MSATQFFKDMVAYAKKASQETSVPVSVILAQWGLESGYGTSRFAREGLNFGGIKLSRYSPTTDYMIQGGSGAKFAKYSSVDQFVTDYIRVLKLGYYDKVRTASNAQEALVELAKSPYDAGHYSGGKLSKVWEQFNLKEYDGEATEGLEFGTINIPKTVLEGDKRFLGWFLLGVGVLVIIKALGGDTRQVEEVAQNA